MKMRWIKRITFGVVAITALFLFTGFSYQTLSTYLDAKRHKPLGEMVDIGGHSLHLFRSGKEGPVVVLETGLGGSSIDWVMIQPALSEVAQVVSYDRAGLGWSDESPLERTSENMVSELHELLVRAEVPAPYILVGYSLGGVNVRLYVDRYPDEVAGVVLIDASHEDQFESMPSFAQPPLWMSHFGLFRLLSHTSKWREEANQRMGRLPSSIKQLKRLQELATKSVKASIAEYVAFEKSLQQLKRSGGHLGARPLRVVSACKTMKTPVVTEEAMKAFHKIFLELQGDLVSKSSRGRQLFAEESDHFVPYHQPEVIVQAVREVMDQLGDPYFPKAQK
jgi:pimeloyl-ACP methyl ester carboxylesterase